MDGEEGKPAPAALDADKAAEAERAKLEKEARRKQWEAERAAKGAAVAKKPLSKKERREKQEREMAAKAKQTAKASAAPPPPKAARPLAPGKPAQGKSAHSKAAPKRSAEYTSALFSHLEAPRGKNSSRSLKVGLGDTGKIHPAVVSVGLKFSEGVLSGANARMVAMLLAFKEVIQDYSTPPGTSLSRHLDRELKPMIQFLIECRPHSITMGNAIRHLRGAISTLALELGEADAKAELCQVIDTYINTNVTLAQAEIVRLALGKVEDGDTIMTFGRSHVVEQILLAAHARGTRFKVVVVNCRPQNEGAMLVRRLAAAGVECAFVLLTSISYMMGPVTKVLLGASALFSNGACLGRAGTALVAMTAKTFNKPVLVCAETHKFTERVQLDSICYNELGDPDDLVLPQAWDGDQSTNSVLGDWRSDACLELLNLTYDLMPQEYITMVVTEFGMLPASSVPVIVREKEQHEPSIY